MKPFCKSLKCPHVSKRMYAGHLYYCHNKDIERGFICAEYDNPNSDYIRMTANKILNGQKIETIALFGFSDTKKRNTFLKHCPCIKKVLLMLKLEKI